MNASIAGKVVLLAGGTGGLGRAVSLAFLEQGATVAVTYQKQAEWEALESAAGPKKGALEGYSVDVTNDEAVKTLVVRLVDKHVRIDALVNTVGGYAGGIKLWEMEPAVMEKMLALNLQ